MIASTKKNSCIGSKPKRPSVLEDININKTKMELNEKIGRNDFLKKIGFSGAALFALYTLESCTNETGVTPQPSANSIDITQYPALAQNGGYIVYNNMVVANITEPSNFFHLLRRQMAWEFRKPCIVMSPKSLLRHPKVVSPIEEFTSGGFREIILDNTVKAKDLKRVHLCSGKIYSM